MALSTLKISWHVGIDPTTIRYWDNENANGTRNGLSWATAWRDGEGTVGQGSYSLIKATETPYRMVFNAAGMSNDTFICDCTGSGFERGSTKADLRASNTFSFTEYESNIYSAAIADVLTGARSGAFGFDYPGHYLYAETLNFEGAWGVWWVVGPTEFETVNPLTRVLNYEDLEHGTWYWDSGTMYICWEQAFTASQFEVVRNAKSFEMWTDTLPEDGKKSAMFGCRSRFGLFGHHNGACVGWRIHDCEIAWNALDGIAIIAENTYAKAYDLYTQIVRCDIHHNYRDGVTNYVTPAGAAGRGNSAWPDVCADFNYIHDNGGAGVFLHRLTRFTVESDYHTVDYPWRLTNNTIVRNARGLAVTDERMVEMITTFGYDQMVPADWEAKTFQQKVDYFNTLYSGYDTAYLKARNNIIAFNDVNIDLVDTTWPNTTFVIDSDYNCVWPGEAPWTEGEHSLYVDPTFSIEPTLSGNSSLIGVGDTPFTYPQNTEATAFYFGKTDPVLEAVNIGASIDGFAISSLSMSWSLITATITTNIFDIGEAVVSDPIITISALSHDAMVSIAYEPDENEEGDYNYMYAASLQFYGITASALTAKTI